MKQHAGSIPLLEGPKPKNGLIQKSNGPHGLTPARRKKLLADVAVGQPAAQRCHFEAGGRFFPITASRKKPETTRRVPGRGAEGTPAQLNPGLAGARSQESGKPRKTQTKGNHQLDGLQVSFPHFLLTGLLVSFAPHMYVQGLGDPRVQISP